MIVKPHSWTRVLTTKRSRMFQQIGLRGPFEAELWRRCEMEMHGDFNAEIHMPRSN